MTKGVITVNGRSYDAITGLAIENKQKQEVKTSDFKTGEKASKQEIKRGQNSASAIHKKQTSSKTLSRRLVKAPAKTQQANQVQRTQQVIKNNSNTASVNGIKKLSSKPRNTNIQRSAAISKFPKNSTVKQASHKSANIDGFSKKPAQKTQQVNQVQEIKKPEVKQIAKINDFNSNNIHPLAAKINQKTIHPQQKQEVKPKHTPAVVLKNEAINEAMAKAQTSKKRHKGNISKREKRFNIAGIASASLAVMLLAGYFTYINIPHLSVRMAATQSGIAATYPSYKPDGYKLDGQIGAANGEVDMRFVAVAGETSYSITQKESSWDSSAVSDFVKSQAKTGVTTTQTNGLTIYSYENGATWVNKGILYTIEGDAPLTGDQIKKIATSM